MVAVGSGRRLKVAPLPVGFEVALDPTVKLVSADLLSGGSPTRFLRLNTAGLVALAELRRGMVTSPAGAALGRRLTDIGMVHPRLRATAVAGEVTVVIPVRDRPGELDRCLDALGSSHAIVVVDDGSLDAEAVTKVAASHGAEVVHRRYSGGPGAARNLGCQVVDTELVAFLDSDCHPAPGWIEALAGHFADPLVAAAAPRIVAADRRSTQARRARGSTMARYGTSRMPLDLGPLPARVQSMTRVSYVPTAALLVRRSALVEAAGFDEGLRYGEDVDLIWRLDAAGWRIRYDPSVTVRHDLPDGWVSLLRRRYAYGTSAAPLAERHPGMLAPLVLSPWPTAVVLAGLARRPGVAVGAYATGVVLLARRLRLLPVRSTQAGSVVAAGVWQTWLGLGRCADQFIWPALLVALARPGPGSMGRRLGRRLSILGLVASPAAVEWWRRRGSLDPLRFSFAYLADEAAYGLGVYRGCLRHRTSAPLRPKLLFRSRRRPSEQPGGA